VVVGMMMMVGMVTRTTTWTMTAAMSMLGSGKFQYSAR
jgi:hypothetical protein